MFRCHIGSLIIAGTILIAACDQAPEPTTKGMREDPVVVYAAFEDDAYLQPLFSQFTEESGVQVIVRRGIANRIVDDLIENKISPPADVLVTHSVTHIWRAAEEGAIRPLYSESVRERSPAWSRDPDDLWFATRDRTAVLVYAAGINSITGSLSYAELAEARFEDDLCLSSSTNAMNQVVISMLIHEHGVRPAELVVRGWMKNLAMPVFESDSLVLKAIASGECNIGIVSSASLVGAKLSVHIPSPAAADIDGIGIGRHARNPEGAAALLEWMLSTQANTAESDPAGSESVSRWNVSLAAGYATEAEKLAERAHYP